MENTYHCYANRELSWLRFNERVLEEAEDSRLPLCERLSFLSIFQSNLDEFFMVRIGSLQDQMLLDKNARENKTNMTSGEQIDAALAFIHKLTARRDAAYNGLLEQLAEQGIRLLDFAHMEEESRTELEKLFRQDYLPLLSSFIISKKQAFPFLKNKGIYAVAVLSTKAEKKKIVKENSSETYILADSSKAGKSTLCKVFELGEVPIICDKEVEVLVQSGNYLIAR